MSITKKYYIKSKIYVNFNVKKIFIRITLEYSYFFKLE